MSTKGGVETEIKLPLAEPEATVALIGNAGFQIHRERVLEVNHVYDTSSGVLRAGGQLLRLREAGDVSTLTWKGQTQVANGHRSRPEIETTIGEPTAFDSILSQLGYQKVFRYEKYRTEYTKSGEDGVITLDETPIGWFVELEGESSWIDATAALLGFSSSQYITASYGTLYMEYCRKAGKEPDWMVFSAADQKK